MSKGRFGIHGGQYIPETLMNAVIELEEAYNHYKDNPEFNRELTELLNEYAGRPSRLYYAAHMTEDLGGAKVYLKREDLNHTGAHKINNVLGQVLLAKKMGKTRVIAETGAGQHGVATATAAALMGMECEVFMGKEDTERQALNVYKMRLLGAKVHPVTSGTATLKDAVSETMREWTNRIADTHYVLGSVMGPHPFPTIVRDFQAVISKEIKEQMLEKEGKLPDAVLACVGGGSNAIGTFYHFIDDNALVFSHLWYDFSCVGNCVGAFDCRNDAFCSGKIFKCFYRFFVGYRHILGAAGVIKMGMLRSDSRIVKACGNRVYGSDLAVLVLAEIGFHSVENAKLACGDGGCCFCCIDASSCCLTADELYVFVFNEMIEGSDGIGAAILSQLLSVIFRQLSPKKSKSRCWKKKASSRMQSLHA